MHTTVSILLPTYEPDAELLKRAMESLMRQTHDDWRLFIRDDASTKNVRDLLEMYLANPRITFEKGKDRLGIGGNWNACLAAPKSFYVQYLFQDDTWNENYLKNAVDALESHHNCGILSAEHRYLCDEALGVKDLYREVEKARADMLKPGTHDGKKLLAAWMDRGLRPNVIGEPSFVMLRRATVEKAGRFREDMDQCLDTEYWTRCLAVTDLYALSGDNGTFHVHRESASSRHYAEGRGLFDRLQCMEGVLERATSRKDRKIARAAISRELNPMMRKFLKRLFTGNRVRMGGSGGRSAMSFCIRHPLIAMRAVASCLPHK